MKSFVKRGTEKPSQELPPGHRAYDELRRQILHGDLPGGTRLIEDVVANRLGVSRTPVRETFRDLMREGLIDEAPRRQIVVTSMPLARREEVARLRAAVERVAIADAATVMSVSAVDQLRLSIIQQNRAFKAGDAQSFYDRDDEFHVLIAKGAQLDLVAEYVRQLSALTRLAMLEDPSSAPPLAKALEAHDLIADCLEAGDADGAETALMQHVAVTANPLTTTDRNEQESQLSDDREGAE